MNFGCFEDKKTCIVLLSHLFRCLHDDQSSQFYQLSDTFQLDILLGQIAFKNAIRLYAPIIYGNCDLLRSDFRDIKGFVRVGVAWKCFVIECFAVLVGAVVSDADNFSVELPIVFENG